MILTHNDYKSFKTNDCYIKLQCIHASKLDHVKNRILDIFNSKIPNLQKPNRCLFKKYSNNLAIVKLEFKWLEYMNLTQLIHFRLLKNNEYLKKTICEQIQNSIQTWKSDFNFIHGDISPNNILIHNNQIIFIDWLLNLHSYTGTPNYSSESVYKGIHNFDSDSYAAVKIISELKSI